MWIQGSCQPGFQGKHHDKAVKFDFMDENTTRAQLKEHIATRLVGTSGGLITFPTIMLPLDRYSAAASACRIQSGKRIKAAPTAEVVRIILGGLGFCAERTRKDAGGYVKLFRELLKPAPWVETEPNDLEDDISLDRSEELTPLYLRKDTESSLIEQYKQAYFESLQGKMPLGDESVTSETETTTFEWVLDDFVHRVRLARAMGPATVEKVCEAIFDYDEFSWAPGTPDLFVWDPDRHPVEWFFAEVKGPKDHLQASQVAWLRCHWNDIEGRFVVIALG